jgi:hypothetical protein
MVGLTGDLRPLLITVYKKDGRKQLKWLTTANIFTTNRFSLEIERYKCLKITSNKLAIENIIKSIINSTAIIFF